MIDVMEKESISRKSTNDLGKFFYPESLVVIGVSIKRLNLGQIIVSNNQRIGCKARVYGVGRDAGDLNGIPVFNSVKDLPEVPDVAIIITPAKTVPDIMRACAEKGIKHIVIESGGFSEFSASNRSLEKEVLSIARENGIRLIGPNCIGTICLEHRLMMPFVFSQSSGVQIGSVSIVTQSGGVGDTLLKIVVENQVFFNKFIATGNKLDLDEVDFLEYLIQDESTKAIIMYLEGFSRGRAFFEAAMKSPKPIIVFKSNRYPLSAKIAQSHTAALSASDEVVSAALQQAAVIRVNGEDELMVAAKSLKMPPIRGKRLAVLSRSGGHAVVTVDACAQYGLDLVEFPAEFLKKIGTLYNTNVIAHQNPLDLGEIFDYTIFTRILEETISLEGIDGLIFNHNYQSNYEAQMSRTFLDGVKELVEKHQRPVAITLISDAKEVLDVTMNHPYPTFAVTHHAVQALWNTLDYIQRKEKRDNRGVPESFPVRWEEIEKIRNKCRNDGRIPLTDEALAICAATSMEPTRYAVVKNAKELQGIDLRYPVAVKLLSRDASHKTDVGGVKLNLSSPQEAMAAVEEMSRSVREMNKSISIDGFILQEMAPKGEEFFIGARHDGSFGPIIMVGMGGVFIELFKDRSIRLAPVTRNEAEDMVRQLKAFPLLNGYRGRPALDVRALVDCICKVSNLISGTLYIDEIDLNPVILHPVGLGVSIVDSRVFFR